MSESELTSEQIRQELKRRLETARAELLQARARGAALDLPFQPGSLITADELNVGLVALLERILHHRHQGNAAEPADSRPLNASALEPGSVATEQLNDFAVTREKIAPAAVSADQLAEQSVAAEHLAAGAVVRESLADDAVNSAKLAPELRSRLEQLSSGPTTYGFIVWINPDASLTPDRQADDNRWWDFEPEAAPDPALEVRRFTDAGDLARLPPYHFQSAEQIETGSTSSFLTAPGLAAAASAAAFDGASDFQAAPQDVASRGASLVLPSGIRVGGTREVGRTSADLEFVVEALEREALIGGGAVSPQQLERKRLVTSFDPSFYGVTSWTCGVASFHPGIGSSSAFTIDNQPLAFRRTTEPNPAQRSAVQNLFYHFDAEIDLNSAQFEGELLARDAFRSVVNNPQNLPAGYMSRGDVNIRSIIRLRESGELPDRVRLNFELPYRTCDYTVNATVELGKVGRDGSENASPLLFPMVVRRAKTYCELTFVDPASGTVSNKASFNVAVHGTLGEPTSSFTTVPTPQQPTSNL